MTPLILSNEWLEQLCRSQGINYERVTRVIVDARAGHPVLLYVTQLGDAGLMVDVGPPEVVPPKVQAH